MKLIGFKLLLIPVFLLCFLMVGVCYANNAEHSIIKQPMDISVDYPNSASFSVEVSEPDEVAEYQWISYTDGSIEEFELDGSSAKTNTLILPSTKREYNNIYFKCFIKYKDNKSIETKPAKLTISNHKANLPVIYVGEYALQPGSTLSLSNTNLGSGNITYADISNIIVDNVNFNNLNKAIGSVVFDCQFTTSCNNQLINYTSDFNETPEFNVIFKGKNEVFNSAKFSDGEERGMHVIEFFSDSRSPSIAKLNLVGEAGSSLSMTGGECFVINNGNIDIKNMNINIKSLKNNRSDKYGSITAYNSSGSYPTVENGVNIYDSNIVMDVFGSGIFSDKVINFFDTAVDINSKTGTPQGGWKGAFNVVYAKDTFSAKTSDIDINVDDERAVSLGICMQLIGISCCDSYDIEDSDVDISIAMDDPKISGNVQGINVAQNNPKTEDVFTSKILNSNVDINLGTNKHELTCSTFLMFNAEKINLEIVNSKLVATSYVTDYSMGIRNLRDTTIKDSDIELNINQSGKSNYGCCRGITVGGVLTIDLNKEGNIIKFNCNAPNDEFAFGIGSMNEIKFVGAAQLAEKYHIGDFKVVLPDISEKSTYQIVYDKTKPALDFAISVPIKPDSEPVQDTIVENKTVNTGDYTYVPLIIFALVLVFSIKTSMGRYIG